MTKLENGDGSLPDHTEEMLRLFEREQRKRDAEAKRRNTLEDLENGDTDLDDED
jgi:hypothetical protein